MDAIEIIIWAMALVMPLLGGYILGRFLKTLGRCRRSLAWPVATGVIMGPAPDDATAGEAAGGRDKVKYRYEVDGRHYMSHRVFIGDGSTPAWADLEAEMTAGQHAPIHRVDVYYDPDDPRVCVLRPGVHSAIFSNLFVGLIIAGIGIALLLFLISQIDISGFKPE